MPTMQTDVLATKPLTATGNFKDQNNNDIPRCRIKTIYAVNGTDAGSVVIREGGATGDIIATINNAAAGGIPVTGLDLTIATAEATRAAGDPLSIVATNAGAGAQDLSSTALSIYVEAVPA